MSRGFVREEDQEEAPFIPPRAALPPGVQNYVTPAGFKQLQKERADLESERKNLNMTSDKERRHATAVIDGKLRLLMERIASARVINPGEQLPDEVRFGATVTFKYSQGERKGTKESFTIVGVDEGNIKKRKIAFTAPLARAISGKRVGEEAQVVLGGKTQQLTILDIHYTT